MKKRVLISGLFHETHTFLDGTTGLGDFHITRGQDMLMAKGDSSPLGGVLELAEEFGWEVLPTVDYRAQPSATVEDDVVETFWKDFINHAEPHFSQPLDAFYFVLHGAMTSQRIQDVEGELLQRIRAIPALAKLPLFGVFDLHANFTARMAALSECLVGYRENPHTDAREAACVSARLLQRCLSSGELPHQKVQICSIVWPPTGTATSNDPMKTLETMAREMEKRSGIWSVSVVAGFAFADTKDTGVSLLATGTDQQAMEDCLKSLSAKAHELRGLGNVIDPPLNEIMELVLAATSGLTVLVEPSDNIGGGAPGDGTGLLRALLDFEVANSAICIADPAAVKAAAASGIGSRVTLSIGGKGSRLDAGPVELEVEVIALSDGCFELEDKQSHLASMCGDRFDMGPTAVVRHTGLTILLTSTKTPPFDLGQWRSQGIEPTQLSVIAVKAAVAHRRAYDPIAARMLWVDTPGPCSSNLKTLPYKHIRRPIYPLDA
ncbi:MAG: M81 family metallopeptidase [Verrucomicrobiaceae bacterium]|nr:M81 family metallopeptidase [Verrucomicrobiaceae bacterium]